MSDADLRVLLKRYGLRFTRARQHILTLLYGENRHYTADEMLNALKAQGYTISAATLYQNLRQLNECGVLTRFAGANGVLRYDSNISRHDHIICERCNRVMDVVTSGPLNKLYPRPLSDEASDLAQWQLNTKQIEYQGLCPDCQTA